MKFRWEKKYLYWGVTAFSVIAASMLFYSVIFQMSSLSKGLSKISDIFMPIILGGIIAYLLTPVMNFLEHKIIYALCKRNNWKISAKGKKIVRMGCIIISLLFSLWIIYALLAMLIPQLFNSITNIIENFPHYIDTVQKWVADLFRNNPDLDSIVTDFFDKYSLKAETWLSNEFLPQINNFVINFSSGVFDIFIFLKNFLIGSIISVYIMYNKETFAAKGKRIMFSLVKPALANNIIRNLSFIHGVFGGFISGKIIDSIIIGILCYIGTSIIGTPYAILISVIVGVTNVIPFFGPYIGAIPCAFLILLVSPIQCLYFIIFILVLQQFDGNILGPKILGSSTGLSSFMVIVAILIGGGFFGIIGMFVGVPVCAVICAVANQSMQKRLHNRSLPVELTNYMRLDSIDIKTLKPVYKKDSDGDGRKKYPEFKKYEWKNNSEDSIVSEKYSDIKSADTDSDKESSKK